MIPTVTETLSYLPAMVLTSLLTFFLVFYLTFYLAYLCISSDRFSGILFGPSSDILSGRYSDILSAVLSAAVGSRSGCSHGGT